jgi:hypothetical protein
MSAREVRRRRRLAAQRALEAFDDATVHAPSPEIPDAELAKEVRAMDRTVALLQDLPEDAWALSVVPQPEPRVSRALRGPGPRPRLILALAAATAAICLALGFAGGALLTDSSRRSPAPPATHGRPIILRPLTSTLGGSLAVAFMTGPGQMVVHIDHLPPSAPDTYYELWLMTDARHLTPMAAFRIGSAGEARLRLRLPDEPSHYRYLDISQQRLDGGTGHSGDSVLRGRIT